MPSTKADLDQLDAIHGRLASYATGPAAFDRPIMAVERDLFALLMSMRRDSVLATATAADTLTRVQGALDRLDFYVASLGADPGLVARVDELKTALGVTFHRREAAIGA